MARVFVTGGSGFIGSNLVDALLSEGHVVKAWDNMSTGRARFLTEARANDNFTFVQGDLLDKESLTAAVEDSDVVVHLAANADVRFGWEHPTTDTQQNVIATQNVLEAMRHHRVSRIVFSSTGSVYGRAEQIPTPEDARFPIQTSLYGASKLSAEGLISAYAEAGYVNPTVFRFVSILGPRYTHGHVYDFVRQLTLSPRVLTVLGNGYQRKSYLHVSDCVEAIVLATKDPTISGFFNLGTDEYCTVRDSVSWICDELSVHPRLEFGVESSGWIGDNPFIYLDTQKIRGRGWSPRYSIQESVRLTTKWLSTNKWVLEDK